MLYIRQGSSAMLALACLALFGGAAAASAPPAAPPDGSYAFDLNKAGQKFGSTTVSVKHESTGITLHEAETFSGIQGQFVVDETLEPVGLTPTAYVTTFPLKGSVTATAKLAFDSGGAKETVDGTSGSTDFRLARGTSHQVVLDGAAATGFLMLPAQAKAQGLKMFTSIAPSSAKQLVFAVSASASPSRPSGVPAADTSLSITGPVSFVEWYNPQTMVVDEIDVPSQQVTIVRRAH